MAKAATSAVIASAQSNPFGLIVGRWFIGMGSLSLTGSQLVEHLLHPL